MRGTRSGTRQGLAHPTSYTAAREERAEIAAAGMGKYDNAPYTRGGREGAGAEVRGEGASEEKAAAGEMAELQGQQ